MKRFTLMAALLIGSPVQAQTPDPHAGHVMAKPKAQPAVDPHAGHVMPAPAADPHAGHVMPVPAADPHAGHFMPAAAADPHAGHTMPMATGVQSAPPPPVPTDHAAEQFYTPAEMTIAREGLRREHGDMSWSKVMLEIAEYRPGDGGDGFAWEARASFGGDINRVVVKSQGEGAAGHTGDAELHALYARAITPYFNLQAGLRHDVRPTPQRTYATVGIEGLAPYWFEVDTALFLSDKGDVSARFEASYDLRRTSRVTLEPRIEANVQAQDIASMGLGAGLADVEAGLRLRYALTPEIGPYIGVNHARMVGDTADFARANGDAVRDTRFVVGLRAWF